MEWTQIGALIGTHIVLTGWTYWMKKRSDAAHKAWVEARDMKAHEHSEGRKRIEWEYIERRDQYEKKRQEKATDKLDVLQSSIDTNHETMKNLIETYLSKIGKPLEKKE